jgi:hypothetical protein
LIAELSVPEDSDASRILLSQLVRNLKQQAIFSKVDLLSDDLRRNLANPNVMVSNRDFVLAMDFANSEFQPVNRAKRSGTPSSRSGAKRPVRQSQPGSESTDAPAPSL